MQTYFFPLILKQFYSFDELFNVINSVKFINNNENFKIKITEIP